MVTPSSSQSSSSVNRKLLKKPDALLESLQKGVGTLPEYKKPLLILFLGTLAVIFLVLFFSSQNEKKEELARDALFSARETLDKETETLEAKERPAENPAQPGAKNAVKNSIRLKTLDVDQNFAKGVEALKKVAADFDASRSGFEAKLLLGNLYYDHGDPTKAADWFKKASEKSPGKFEQALALHSLGFAYENLKKLQESNQTYQQALQLGFVELKGDLLLAMARNYETLKDTAKAKATYDQIIKELPDTQYATHAQTSRARLQ